MKPDLRQELIDFAKSKIGLDDTSHDFSHAERVLKNVELIAKNEKADLEILIPAALFHDIIIYPKNDKRSKQASDESADFARDILTSFEDYPKEKIPNVEYAIKTCSYSKNIKHETIEAKILQDADSLEATGAISIMRTFASTGQMKRAFYCENDPFCENREPNSKKYGLDLFYNRLLIVKDRMYTETAKRIAKRRTKFLLTFLYELKLELNEKQKPMQ